MARHSLSMPRVSLIYDDDASMTSLNSSRNTSFNGDESSLIGLPASKRKRMSTPGTVVRRLSGHLFSWGDNGVGGQLGHGSRITQRCKPKLIEGLASKQVVAIAAGGMHSACVTADGLVYTFGCNDDKQLGRTGEKPDSVKEEDENKEQKSDMEDDDDDDDDDEDERLITPGLVETRYFAKRNVSSLVAGDRYTAVMTDEGQVYAWGTFMMEVGGGRSIGILPHKDAPRQQATPALIEGIDEEIIKLTGGDQHIAMLSSKGQVWTMGVGFVGQLGRISDWHFDEQLLQEDKEHYETLRNDQLTPKKVIPRHTLSVRKSKHRRQGYYVDVWSGAYCTVALAHKDCDVYGWGLNVSNQLGLEDGNDRYRPKKLDVISNGIRWRKIAFGLRHSLLMTDGGHIWAVGEEHYGRLGLGENCGPQSAPKQIEGIDEVIDIDCGPYTSTAVTRMGQLYTWGRKGIELGQCSKDELDDDSVGDIWSPTYVVSQQLEKKQVLAVALAGQHCLALATDPSNVH